MELIIISIAYILGIIWGLYFNISIAFFVPCIIVIYVLIKKEYKKYLLITCITIIISNVYINILENSFNTKYEDITGDKTIIGTIVSEPKIKNNSTQCIVKVEIIDSSYKYNKSKILLNINSTYNRLKVGNKIEIYGELEDAETAKNEGGFNYNQYLKLKGIYKTISVKKNKIKILKDNNFSIIENGINCIRSRIKDSAKKIFPEKEANFLIAIIIGDKQELDEGIQQDFRNSNLSHILAVSGMHVSFIIMGLTFILNKIKIGKNRSKIFIIMFLVFFIFLTGGSPSVQRACIMSIYLIVGNLLHKKTNILNSIAFSSLVILIINPYNLLDIGFQLSFGGTLGIVLIYPKLKQKFKIKSKIIGKILDIALVTVSANIVIFPIVLYYYSTISTTFLLSNLLVSCIIGIILIFGIVIIILSYICFSISNILGIVEKILIDILLQIANIIGGIPFSQVYFITPQPFMIIVYYLFLYLWR